MVDIVISVPHSHSVDSLQAKLSTLLFPYSSSEPGNSSYSALVFLFRYGTVHEETDTFVYNVSFLKPPPWSTGQSSRGPGFDSRRYQIF
jgi:hypothetical protein